MLIGNQVVTQAALAGTGNTDLLGAITTPFRRFESIAFDQYGYFSQSVGLTAATATSATAGSTTTFTVTDPPDYGGSVFVSDLATGLYITVTPVAPLPTSPILVPIQGSGTISVSEVLGSSRRLKSFRSSPTATRRAAATISAAGSSASCPTER